MTGAIPNPREMALRALLQVEGEGAPAQNALESALAANPGAAKRDRALATELVYGSLRRRNALDWAVAQVSRRALDDLDPPVRAILRLGAYQLLFLDRVPVHAAVNESVALAVKRGHRGAVGFVNGVLRGLARRLGDGSVSLPGPSAGLETYLTVTESHPGWLVRRWLAELGPADAEAICRFDNESAPTVIRANRLKNSREELAGRLSEEGVPSEPTRYAPEGLVLREYSSLPELEAFREGRFFAQDEAAMLVAPLLDPRPGETLVDSCSAPGGKATHLAEMSGDAARVIAVEVARDKLSLIEENCRRLGLTAVGAVAGDARDLAGMGIGLVDGVIVDAPCSGLGVLRRRPDSRWRKRPGDPASLAVLQLELLDGAARVVRPSGRVVYSTCTIGDQENGAVVRAFLESHPGWRLGDLRPFLPPALRGEPGAASGALQLLPSRHGTDGFFLARLERGED